MNERSFPSSAALAACILAIALATSPGVASAAEAGWSASAPLRHQIDGTCDAYAPHNGAATYHLTRYSTPMMKMKSGWMLSDPAHDVRIMNSPNFSQGDFVTVVARGDQILSAMLSSTDGSGDGGTLVAYCFIDGALARASAEVGDVTDEMAWTHTVYYRSGKPVSDATVAHDLAKKRLVSPPPAPTAALQITVYESPDKLPFYTAFKSARAGTLSRAK
jgi:hypothetical protein